MTTTAEVRRRLFRELALGLSVHRLYPGQVATPPYAEAVDAVRRAATDALVAGMVHARVRTDGFLVEGDLLDQEPIPRLALACYERRIEHLSIAAPPTATELVQLFELLSRPPAQDDAPQAAAGSGGRAIAIRAGTPVVTTGDEQPEPLRTAADPIPLQQPPHQRTVELQLGDGESGSELYTRLRALAPEFDDDGYVTGEFYRCAARLVEQLEPTEAAAFGRLVVDHLGQDRFAEHFTGHLSDLALSRMLEQVARTGGPPARDLAAAVSADTGRRTTVADLANDAPDVDDLGTSTGPAALVGAFPVATEERRRLGLTTLLDFLCADPDPDRLAAVIEAVLEQARDHLRRGQHAALLELLDVLDRVHDGPVRSAVARVRRDLITPALLWGLAGVRLLPPDEVMARLGPAAVDALITALDGDGPDRSRQVLAGLLRVAAATDLAVVADRIGDIGWRAARELVQVLGSIDDPRALDQLRRLLRHPHRDVQDALISCFADRPPAVAAPALAEVIRYSGDSAIQRRGIDVLATQATEAAQRELARLASRRTIPPLSRAVRRYARRRGAAR